MKATCGILFLTVLLVSVLQVLTEGNSHGVLLSLDEAIDYKAVFVIVSVPVG